MGFPWGTVFAAFCPVTIENKVVPKYKDIIYNRYEEDTIVVMDILEYIEKLQEHSKNSLVAKFHISIVQTAFYFYI